MSLRELERVVLHADVDKPRNDKGAVPGLEHVFEKNPTMGRWACELLLDDSTSPNTVIIRDPVSGEENTVPLTGVKNYITCESRERAKKHREKAAGKGKAA